MVKQRKKNNKKNNRKQQSSKGVTANSAKSGKINASTEHETCDEQLSPFGGLLAVIKFFDRDQPGEFIFKYYEHPARAGLAVGNRSNLE
jgi:hypothetical protein